jgi:hypothetical protein
MRMHVGGAWPAAEPDSLARGSGRATLELVGLDLLPRALLHSFKITKSADSTLQSHRPLSGDSLASPLQSVNTF